MPRCIRVPYRRQFFPVWCFASYADPPRWYADWYENREFPVPPDFRFPWED